MKIFIVSGVSGSGKSLCLDALEDLNIYCIDNLPAAMIPALVEYGKDNDNQCIGVGIDARNINSLNHIENQLVWLKKNKIDSSIIFLEAADEEIIKRYKKTRRKHPIITEQYSLSEAIALERKLLSSIKERASILFDTTQKTPHQLRRKIRDYVIGDKDHELILRFESFGYKHGLPRDADFVFDVRSLPNPHWDERLRDFTGKDKPIIDFLQQQPMVSDMIEAIYNFLNLWLESFKKESRSHITVAIGCTGGKHRSVYITELLAQKFSESTKTQAHHRDLMLEKE